MNILKYIFEYYMKYLQINGIYIIIALKRKRDDKSNKFIDHYFAVFISNMLAHLLPFSIVNQLKIDYYIYEKNSLIELFIDVIFFLSLIITTYIFFKTYFNKKEILKLYKRNYYVEKPLLKSAIIGTLPLYLLLVIMALYLTI